MADEWMNAEIREQTEALQRTHGFVEDEALAFWHLQRAGKLMNEMRSADLQQEIGRRQGQDDEALYRQVIVPLHAARWHSLVYQHFAALRNVLGDRVLRRHYPDGWGSRYEGEISPEMAE